MANEKHRVLIVNDNFWVNSVVQMIERREPPFVVQQLHISPPPRAVMEDTLCRHLMDNIYDVVVVPTALEVLPVVKAQHTGSVVGYGVLIGDGTTSRYDGLIDSLSGLSGSMAKYWIDTILKHLPQ